MLGGCPLRRSQGRHPRQRGARTAGGGGNSVAVGSGGGENNEPRVAVTHLEGAGSVATGEGAVARSMDVGSAVAEAGPGKTNARRREP
jgi:hypothetical protein